MAGCGVICRVILDWIAFICRFIGTVFSFIAALWMHADMGLDINQSMSYYQDTFNENGSYQIWALKHRNTTHADYLQGVAPTYFYLAASIWAGPPVLSAFILANTRGQRKNLPGWGQAVYYLIFIVIFIPAGVLLCYIYAPIITLVHAVRKLWYGDDLDEDKRCLGFSYENAPNLKLAECLGEAIPQLILAIVYAANNYPYLLEHDDYFGIGIPVTIISCIFSAGSIVWGLKSAVCIRHYQYFPDFTSKVEA